MAKVTSAAQMGVLLSGPGALRVNSIQANLVPLLPEQQELVNKAKKYAMEQSIKSILMRQALTSQQQQQKSLQRHQALILMCRVYIGSISFELKEETIKAAFAVFGAIKSINMSWDPVTLKHKGFAFIEYELPEAAQLALEHMNGIQLGGRQIKVGRPSNMPQAAPIIQQIQEECKEKNRIYVSNVCSDITELELANLFDPFGKVCSCKLAMTPNVADAGHRGYGFIEFENEAAATEALTMDNFDLGGETLHVCRATTPADNLSTYGTLESEIAQPLSAVNNNQNSDEDIQVQLERANKEQEQTSVGDNSVETTTPSMNDGSSSSMLDNNNTQTEMKTICPPSDAAMDVTTSQQDNGHSSSHPIKSNIIVLRNMITAEEEIDDSLQLDVYEECSKYGPITQVVIYVDKASTKREKIELVENDDDGGGNNREAGEDGEVDDEKTGTTEKQQQQDDIDKVKIFIKYKNNAGSQKAREALDGRFFAGRKVSAEHYDQIAFRLSDYSQ